MSQSSKLTGMLRRSDYQVAAHLEHWKIPSMFIEGLSDWEKRRLALILKERGHTAFMVIKHAKAAMLSLKRNRPINTVDQLYLTLLDDTIHELYGYQRAATELTYGDADNQDQQTNG